jgi:N-acetylglucosamine kinase-like BadF-type ATPase
MGLVTEVVVAVDGGGTKTDAVALTLTGEVLGRRRGPGSSPHSTGLSASVDLVDALVRDVAGSATVRHAGLYLSGLDLPRELVAYQEAVAGLAWARQGIVIDNDLFALLRAGTDAPDAIAIVCGTGINAVGLRADGACVRFPSLGPISGDWGGGSGLGSEVLWHAARDVDGRGPHTLLTAAVCSTLGVATIPELIEQLHFGLRDSDELARLAPDVFAAADAGDATAIELVIRQADEVVALARACVNRLDLAEAAVPIVLGGGILQSRHELLMQRIAAGVAAIAPAATLVSIAHPPIVGAAVLALRAAGADRSATERARVAFSPAL